MVCLGFKPGTESKNESTEVWPRIIFGLAKLALN